MGKFTDDVPLRDIGAVQPPSARLLIRKLKVEKAGEDIQSEAIRRWLMKNDPLPSLESSLRRHGLGGLLRNSVAPRPAARPHSAEFPNESFIAAAPTVCAPPPWPSATSMR